MSARSHARHKWLRLVLLAAAAGLIWAFACPHRILTAMPAAISSSGQQSTTSNTSQPAPQHPQTGYIIRSQTNVVLVDVRVFDKSGMAVTDLKPGDFRVYEDGVEQKISSFSFENVEKLQAATGPNAAPAVIDLSNLPPKVTAASVVQDHRMIVLFFDMTSMPIDDLMRILKAADAFLSKQMSPADLVAIATYTSDLRIVRDFTNDRAALEKSLDAIRLGEESSLSEAGSEGEAGTTNASGEEVVTQDVSAAFTPDETEFNIFNTDEKLAAIESLSEMLQHIPCRKSIIHFSSGVERTGIENQAQLRATTDAANRADVSLYTVDARGLLALPPGGDASTASPAGTAIYSGQAVHSQESSLWASRETLASLASDTGGKTFYDLNDFSKAFRDVETDNSTYYLLGYSPANLKSDGRFRRIRVEVDRPGVKVESRPGYYAPKNFRQFTREDKEVELEQAMDLDTPFVDLPMAVETSYFRQPDGKFYVVLAAKIPGSAISFLQKSQTHRTEFDFAWRATDPAGHTAGAVRDTLPVKLSGETYEQVLEGNILYEGGMVLPSGNYRLKAVVRENESGRLGTFEQPLVLPNENDKNAPALALSSVVVSNELRPVHLNAQFRGPRGPGGFGPPFPGVTPEQVTSPLVVGSRSVVPSVTRVFRTSQELYVYLESYQPSASKDAKESTASQSAQSNGAGSIAPSVALVFFRGGVKISEAGPFPGKQQKSRDGKVSYFVRIPLAKFPPGRYWLQVNVLDPAADLAAFSRLPLAIMPPPARPSAPRAGK